MNQNYREQNPYQQVNLPSCLRCRVQMQFIMQIPIRTGGSQGFFSDWGEWGERILLLDTYRCPNCRKLEFFDLDASLPKR